MSSESEPSMPGEFAPLPHPQQLSDAALSQERRCYAVAAPADAIEQLQAIREQWEDTFFEFVEQTKSSHLLQLDCVPGIWALVQDTKVTLGRLQQFRHDDVYCRLSQRMPSVETTIQKIGPFQKMLVDMGAIFSSEQLKKHLSEAATEYAAIEKKYFETMARCVKEMERKVLQCCELYAETVLHLHEGLETIQETLRGYLGDRRVEFPRFYFLPDSSLLDMVSERPGWMDHVSAVFGGIKKVLFDEIDNTRVIGMASPEGEKVLYPDSLNCHTTGMIEDWMSNLVSAMRQTMKTEISKTQSECFHILFDVAHALHTSCSPVCLLMMQFRWTFLCEEAIERAQIQKGAWPAAVKSQQALLDELIMATRNENLGRTARKTLESQITLVVHFVDESHVLQKLQPSDCADWGWQKHTRYYWRPRRPEDDVEVDVDDGSCVVACSGFDFPCGYEYWGVKERLSVTSLTDKAYISIANALLTHFGVAMSGFAGTGKVQTVKDLGRNTTTWVVLHNCSDQMDFEACGKVFKGLAMTGAWVCFDRFDCIGLEMLSLVSSQVQCILDAIRGGFKEFEFIDSQGVTLNPKCGFFIAKKPNSSCDARYELPRCLMSQFRVIAMLKPDRQVIMTTKLAAGGFHSCQAVGKKFDMLYQICEQRLSKQSHYDFGLRNILSVLRVCANAKRREPNQPEDVIFMRTVRDMNIGKLVPVDVPVFLSLVADSFPSVRVERARHMDIEAVVADQIRRQGLQHHEDWFDKIVQLYDTSLVRHGLMLVGPAGSGKTTIWHTLARALNMQHTQEVRFNPVSMTVEQLYGTVEVATGSWTDGVFSALWRKACVDDSGSKSKDGVWLIADGPIDEQVMERLNTVLDDNKMLSLQNNEHILMRPDMKMCFETEHLLHASPATVSRTGIIYVGESVLGWMPPVQTWLDQRGAQEAEILRRMFEKIATPIQEFVRRQLKTAMFVPQVATMRSMCVLLEAVLDQVSAKDSETLPETVYERLFVWALTWTAGSMLELPDRIRFDKEMRTLSDCCPRFEDEETDLIYEYFVDMDLPQHDGFGDWTHWSTRLLDIKSTTTKLAQVFVPTLDSARYQHLLELSTKRNVGMLICGDAGSAKTATINNFIDSYVRGGRDLYQHRRTINFSFHTTHNHFQKNIESFVETRRGKLFGPPGGKKMFVFVDDISLPEVNVSGDQPTNEIVRQLLEYNFVYDLSEPGSRKFIEGIQYCAAMSSPGGSRSDISNRLKRQFSIVHMPMPTDAVIKHIFHEVLRAHFGDDTLRDFVDRTIHLWNALKVQMLPTAANVHYAFNMRDLSRVFQGIILATTENKQDASNVTISLWAHECQRVFMDKLASHDDQAWVAEAISGLGDWPGTPVPCEQIYFVKLPDQSGHNCYRTVSIGDVKAVAESNMAKLNETTGEDASMKLELVLFDEALRHFMRIHRILSMPRGSALLVGVSGSGKRSLTRLASFAVGNEMHEITLTVAYTKVNLYHDLKRLFRKASQGIHVTLMVVSDTDNSDDSFFLPIFDVINALLTTGAVPDLFSTEELDELASKMCELDSCQDDQLMRQTEESTEVTDAAEVQADVQAQHEQIDDVAEALTALGQEAQAVEHTGAEVLAPEKRLADGEDVHPEPEARRAKLHQRDMEVKESSLAREAEALAAMKHANAVQTALTDRVRDHLHVVLCFSPEGLRNRARLFPGLLACCNMDWFLAWPQTALVAIASNRFKQIEIDAAEGVQDKLAQHFALVHHRATQACDEYFQKHNRQVYMPTKSYLALIEDYGIMYTAKKKICDSLRDKLDTALEKLEECKPGTDMHANQSVATLLASLATEQWAEQKKQLENNTSCLVGDVALASAFGTYCGVFDLEFRQRLMNTFYKDCKERLIPVTHEFDAVSFLSTEKERLEWSNHGLASDAMSLQNGILATRVSSRWPLLVDPHCQAHSWISRQGKENGLETTQLSAKTFETTIEECMAEGKPLLIEHVAEELDSVLDPILLKQIRRGEGQSPKVQFADKLCDYHDDFCLVLTTKLANPHYSLDMSAKLVIVDFRATDSFDNQLLDVIIKRECSELFEEHNSWLDSGIKSEAKYDRLQSELLNHVASMRGSILDDEQELATVDKQMKNIMEHRSTVDENHEQVKQAETKIKNARDLYQPVAVCGAKLFHVISGLKEVNNIYEVPFSQFKELLVMSCGECKQKAQGGAEPSEPTEQWIEEMVLHLTLSVHSYVRRGLFTDHKLLFSFLVAVKCLGNVSGDEFDCFLKGDSGLNTSADRKRPAKVAWLPALVWANIAKLSNTSVLQPLTGLAEHIEQNIVEWQEWFGLEEPEQIDLPLKHASPFQRCLIVRLLRSDRALPAIEQYVTTEFKRKGGEFEEIAADVSIDEAYQETCHRASLGYKAAPFLLLPAPGVDILPWIQTLATNYNKKLPSKLIMGPTQECNARKLIRTGKDSGQWCVLLDCHLSLNYMPELEQSLTSKEFHEDFRCFITIDPGCEIAEFFVRLLHISIRITAEHPVGIKARMQCSYDCIIQDRLDPQIEMGGPQKAKWHRLLYVMCFVHAVTQERCKFGSIGWSVSYQFDISIVDECCVFLQRHVESQANKDKDVQWERVQYMISHILYGAIIADDFDRKLMDTYVEHYFQQGVLDDSCMLAKYEPQARPAPTNTTIETSDREVTRTTTTTTSTETTAIASSAVHVEPVASGTECGPELHTIDGWRAAINALPDLDAPEVFGMDSNADCSYRTAQTNKLLSTLIDMQVKVGNVRSGQAWGEQFLEQIEWMLALDPGDFDINQAKDDITKLGGIDNPHNVMLLQEVERMNKVIAVYRKTLEDLKLALAGTIVTERELIEARDYLANARPPPRWVKMSWEGPTSALWFASFLQRTRQLQGWLRAGPPSSFWMAGFFNPNAFLVATTQTIAHNNPGWAVDEVVLKYQVAKCDHTDLSSSPEESVCTIHGLWIEGAGWDQKRACLIDQEPREDFHELPAVHITGERHHDADRTSRKYLAPLYMYPRRCASYTQMGTYVDVIDLDTGEKTPLDWRLRGVTLLLNRSDRLARCAPGIFSVRERMALCDSLVQYYLGLGNYAEELGEHHVEGATRDLRNEVERVLFSDAGDNKKLERLNERVVDHLFHQFDACRKTLTDKAWRHMLLVKSTAVGHLSMFSKVRSHTKEHIDAMLQSPDGNTQTALHVACKVHCVLAIQYLLDAGASTRVRDSMGATPYNILAGLGASSKIRWRVAPYQLLGRYSIEREEAEHESQTCVLFVAKDYLPVKTGGEPVEFMLKIMKHKSQFDREVQFNCELDEKYVLKFSDTEVLPEDESEYNEAIRALTPTQKEYLTKNEFRPRYVIAMQQGKCDLGYSIAHERFAGRQVERIRSTLQKVAISLHYLEKDKKVHGDLKPMNILQMRDDRVLLIDWDASAKHGDVCHLKFSSAFGSPQLAEKLVQFMAEREIDMEAFATNDQTGMEWEEWMMSHEHPLTASPSVDIWSFGILLCAMSIPDYAPIFLTSGADNIVQLADLQTLAFSWDEILLQSVERITKGRETDSSWLQAADLAMWCLQRNPERRPQSFVDVLKHPFWHHGLGSDTRTCDALYYLNSTNDTLDAATMRHAEKLHAAIEGRDVDSVKKLLGMGHVHYNLCKLEGPLTGALQINGTDNDMTGTSVSPLMRSAFAGDSNVTKALLEEIRNSLPNEVRKKFLDQRTTLGFTAYMIACACGYMEIAKLLMDKGCSTDLVNSFGKTGHDLLKVSYQEKAQSQLTPYNHGYNMHLMCTNLESYLAMVDMSANEHISAGLRIWHSKQYVGHFDSDQIDALLLAIISQMTKTRAVALHFTDMDSARLITHSLGIRASPEGQLGGGVSVCLKNLKDFGWKEGKDGISFAKAVGLALWGSKWHEVLPMQEKTPDDHVDFGKFSKKLECVFIVSVPDAEHRDHGRILPGREDVYIIPQMECIAGKLLNEHDKGRYLSNTSIEAMLILKQPTVVDQEATRVQINSRRDDNGGMIDVKMKAVDVGVNFADELDPQQRVLQCTAAIATPMDSQTLVLQQHGMMEKQHIDKRLWLENVSRFRGVEMKAGIQGIEQQLLHSQTLAFYFCTNQKAKQMFRRGIDATVNDEGTCVLTVCLKTPSDLGWCKNAAGAFRSNVARLFEGVDKDDVQAMMLLAVPTNAIQNAGSEGADTFMFSEHMRELVYLSEVEGQVVYSRAHVIKAYELEPSQLVDARQALIDLRTGKKLVDDFADKSEDQIQQDIKQLMATQDDPEPEPELEPISMTKQCTRIQDDRGEVIDAISSEDDVHVHVQLAKAQAQLVERDEELRQLRAQLDRLEGVPPYRVDTEL